MTVARFCHDSGSEPKHRIPDGRRRRVLELELLKHLRESSASPRPLACLQLRRIPSHKCKSLELKSPCGMSWRKPAADPNVTVNNLESSRLWPIRTARSRLSSEPPDWRWTEGERQSESALPERRGEPVRRLQTVKHMTSPHHLRERLTRVKSVASGLSWAASSQPIRRAHPAASASISHAPPTDATGGRGASCHKVCVSATVRLIK